MKKSFRFMIIPAILAAMLLLGGCSGEEQDGGSQELISREFFAMDTYMTLSGWGDGADAALADAEDMIRTLENEVSTEISDSEIARLNANGGGTLTDDNLKLVAEAMTLYDQTGGAFNISIYPIMKAWGFTTKDYQVPDDATLQKLLASTDLSTVNLDEKTGRITFGQEDMEIDLGGITKGLASAKAIRICEEAGLEGALINLGGNVQVSGHKPDGSIWKIAVQSPHETEDYMGVIELTDKAVITSGGYERYFEKDGVCYHHIMDPETGYPADSGLISVTIVSDDGMLADGLSTSLFVMGKDKAVSFWREHRSDFDFILMDEDDQIYVSEPIADQFTSKSYQIEVID